jgi:segregation and condensation protein A
MSYEVRTSVFEGPFDLLLHLILKQEVELWEISLARLVDEYITEIEHMGRLDLDVATEFLLIAATLVELKARRLLPGAEELELDEELLRFEERDLLLARLLECKTFKDAARVLDARLGEGLRSLARLAGPEEPFRSLAPDPLEQTSLKSFVAAARRALIAPEAPIVSMDHVAPIRISVRDAVEAVLLRLPDTGSVSFRALVAGIDDRLEVIVRFLACLELYKQGVVELEQVESFADLHVSRLADGQGTDLDAASLADWGDEPVVPENDADEPDAEIDAIPEIHVVADSPGESLQGDAPTADAGVFDGAHA